MNSSSEEDHRFSALLRNRRWSGLVAAQILRQVGTFGMASLTAVLLWQRGSPLAAGVGVAVFFAAGVASPWIAGMLSDRFGRRPLLAATGAVEVLLLATLGLALVSSENLLLVACVMAGLGVVDATNGPLFAPSVVEVVPDQLQVKSSSAMGFAYDGGKIVGALVVAVGLTSSAVQASIVSVVSSVAALVLVLACAPRERPGDGSATVSVRQMRAAPWRKVAAPLFTLIGMTALAAQTTLVLATLAQDRTASVVGLGTATFSIGCVFGTILVVRRKTVATRNLKNGLFAMAAVLAAAALLPSGSPASVLALGAYGVCIGYCWQVAWPLIVPPVPPEFRGTVAGGLQTGVQVSQAAGALVFTSVAATAGSGAALLAAALSIVALGWWASSRDSQ